jgi:tRNA threonylcarbamoyladenosine biosynthesis protein TsaB
VRTLAVDTSTDVASVAVVDGGDLRAELSLGGRARHGEALLDWIRLALDTAELELGDLDLLAVGLGPGSFTGLRVGLGTIKGLALARALPVVGVGSLRVLARGLGVGGDAVAAPLVDAQRGEVFTAAYALPEAGAVSEVLAPLHAEPAEAARRLREAVPGATLALCGTGVRRYRDVLEQELGAGTVIAAPVWDVPRAAILALEAEARLASKGPSNLAMLEPMYLRPSDAQLPERTLRSTE